MTPLLRPTWGTSLLLYPCSHHYPGCRVCLSALEVHLAFFLAKVAPNESHLLPWTTDSSVQAHPGKFLCSQGTGLLYYAQK